MKQPFVVEVKLPNTRKWRVAVECETEDMAKAWAKKARAAWSACKIRVKDQRT